MQAPMQLKTANLISAVPVVDVFQAAELLLMFETVSETMPLDTQDRP